MTHFLKVTLLREASNDAAVTYNADAAPLCDANGCDADGCDSDGCDAGAMCNTIANAVRDAERLLIDHRIHAYAINDIKLYNKYLF